MEFPVKIDDYKLYAVEVRGEDDPPEQPCHLILKKPDAEGELIMNVSVSTEDAADMVPYIGYDVDVFVTLDFRTAKVVLRH